MPLNVLILIYDGINTLDLNGPLDVLCNFALRSNDPDHGPFSITIAAQERTLTAYEFVTIQPMISFYEALMGIKEGQFDILLVPGCAGGPDDRLLKKADGTWGAEPQILQVIRAFIATDNKSSAEKWAMSVCTGAMFLGAAGAFKGLDATTHWAALSELKQICDAYGVSAKNIIPRGVRWVDGGYQPPSGSSKKKTRIVSSGGISCGLDASLFLVEQFLKRPAALQVANIMDYAWRENSAH